MFGFVNNALENLVIRTYGMEKWKEVLLEAGVSLEDHHFLKAFVYDDYDTFALVGAACAVLDLTSVQLMEQFGDQFFHWCEESGYDLLLRLLGRTLGEFLESLDALHDHLQLTYPGMEAPSFRVEEHPSDDNGLYLHYTSKRVGLEHIVRGIILTVCRCIYNVEVHMDIVEKSKLSLARYHAVFAIVPVNPDHDIIQDKSRRDLEMSGSLPGHVTSLEYAFSQAAFYQLFPFHVLFGRDMRVKHMGASMRRLLPEGVDVTRQVIFLPSIMVLERPHTNLDFENIRQHIHTVFVLRMRRSNGDVKTARFKGQMLYFSDLDAIMYVSSPRVRDLKELEEYGLYLSDIPVHDATREIIMTAESKHAHLNMVKRQEELTDELLESKNALTIEKCRTEALLHSILPRSVADQIMNKKMVKPDMFDRVTILFSDICGFTAICDQCTPIEVIGMLNELYTLFDHLTTVNKVYKVETIGDAYMVVGGLPEKCDDHTNRIANLALDMKHACAKVVRPDNRQMPVEIRIGFHSGEVMAGVVGTKTPRYCLFGDCVNVSSRTESNGVVGRINLTDDARRNLDSSVYMLEDRGDVQFKGKTERMHCWFLNGHATRREHDVTVEEARREMSLMDAIVDDAIKEEVMSTTPTHSGQNTPRGGSHDEVDLKLKRTSCDHSSSTAPLLRVRKSSTVLPPALENLGHEHSRVSTGSRTSVGSDDSGRYRDSTGSVGSYDGDRCPFMAGRAIEPQMSTKPLPRRASRSSFSVSMLGSETGTGRSKSDPTPPDVVRLETDGRSRSMVATASSRRAARQQKFSGGSLASVASASTTEEPLPQSWPASLSAAPAELAMSPQGAAAAETTRTTAAEAVPDKDAASLNALPEVVGSRSQPQSQSPSTWLQWYATSTTIVCVALLSLNLYQRLR